MFCEHQPDRPQEWVRGAMAAPRRSERNVHPHTVADSEREVAEGGPKREVGDRPRLWVGGESGSIIDTVYSDARTRPVMRQMLVNVPHASRGTGTAQPAGRIRFVLATRGESSGRDYVGQARGERRVIALFRLFCGTISAIGVGFAASYPRGSCRDGHLRVRGGAV
jgi:hypothetical protein